MEWMMPHGNMQGEHIYLEEGFDTSEDRVKTKGRTRKKLRYKAVREAMEFYFSDANLAKDRYLRELFENDPYIPLEEFLKFNKIKALVSTVEELAKAVKKSEILELSEDSLKVHRTTPVQFKDQETEDACTIYVENLPPEVTHDQLTKVFSQFGKVVYVSLPVYEKTKAKKGFGFVEFDTVEDAAQTIRIFEEKGSCLSPHMLPEKLCSIRTHENFAKSNARDSSKGRAEKHDSSSVKVCDNEELKENSTTDENAVENKSEQTSSKKRKLDCNDDLNGGGKHASKKEKKSKTGEEKLGEEEAAPDQEATDTKTVPETSDTEASTGDKDDGSSEKKKKKNRKKKKRPKERELFASGMLVLSKKEWKRLRAKYLNMQRANMQRVKQQVWEARFLRRQPYTPHPAWDQGRSEMRPPPPPVDAPKPRVTFTPGVIVCVKFNEPMVEVRGFKAEARTQPGVQYVDVKEGDFQAYLRCSGPSEAQQLQQKNFWKNMHIVTGVEETQYWEKISRDREEKLGKKVKPVKGKKKLLRKAEIVKASHLHFD